MGWHMHQMGSGSWMYLIFLALLIAVAGIFITIRTLNRPKGTEITPGRDQLTGVKKMIVIPRIIANLIQLAFSIILVLLSLHLIHLAIGHILNSFRVEEAVEEILNAIWLITVALAVFDLAGIIFDEIDWGGAQKGLKDFKWQFKKFLIVIITALLLELLVVFFRVAKKDVSLMVYPALATLAVCILIISLAFYTKTSNGKGKTELEDHLQILKLKYAKGEIAKTEFQEKMEIFKEYT